MMDVLRRTWDDVQAIPPESLVRRGVLAFLLGVGLTMTAFGSIFIRNMPSIPYGFIPDVRLALFLGLGLFLGAYAAGGGAHRRKTALWPTVGIIIAFHLEEATIHWIGPYPGSITGTRVGLLGTAGSLLALASLALLHVETEAHRLARDLQTRGAAPEEASEVATALRTRALRTLLGVTAGVAGIGVLVTVGEAVFGNDASGGDWVLLAGGVILLVLGAVLVRLVPRQQAAPPT